MRTVEKAPFMSFDHVVREYIRPSRPVLFKNALHKSNIASWTPEVLKWRVGQKIVKVNYSTTGKFSLDQAKGGHINKPVDMKLGDYIDTCLGQPSYYLQQAPVSELFPELMDDIPVQRLLRSELVTAINIWIGSARSISPLHYDLGNNFFLQCYGRKKFILFEPEQIDYLYPYTVGKHACPHISQVDLDNPDLDSFPLFKKADPIEAIVEQGDVLLLPSTTWHQAIGETNSISVNIWFKQFDFQYLLPTMTRFFSSSYREIVSLFEKVIPSQFADFLDFCQQLLLKKLYYEGLVCHVALLERLTQQLLEKNKISGSNAMPIDSDLYTTIYEGLGSNGILAPTDISLICKYINSGKKLLQLGALNCTTEQAVAFCDDIRKLALQCENKLLE